MEMYTKPHEWSDAVIGIEKDGRIIKIETHWRPWDELDLFAEGKEFKIERHALIEMTEIGYEFYNKKHGWSKEKYLSYCRNNVTLSYLRELEIIANKFVNDNF